MDKDEKPREQIKVIDRRRFTAEGDAREGVEDRVPKRETAEAAPQPPPAASSTAFSSGPHAAKNQPTKAQTSSESEEPDLDDEAEEGNGPDFSSLVVSLATQTLVMLGLMPNPETNLVSENIDGAAQLLGILKMLRIKTKKKLTKQENELLEQVMSELMERAVQSGVPDYGVSDFATLVQSLAQQAMMLLGVLRTGEDPTMVNLDAAKYTVDILGMLETKTSGNLSPEETHLLKEVLRQLRLEFAKRVTLAKTAQ